MPEPLDASPLLSEQITLANEARKVLDDKEFLFQMTVFNYAVRGPNEFTAMVSEGYDWFGYSGVPEPWDRTANDLASYRLWAEGRQLPTPWWWALPGVTDLILKYGKPS